MRINDLGNWLGYSQAKNATKQKKHIEGLKSPVPLSLIDHYLDGQGNKLLNQRPEQQAKDQVHHKPLIIGRKI